MTFLLWQLREGLHYSLITLSLQPITPFQNLKLLSTSIRIISIIQSAAAAPYGTFLAVLCPHHSAVRRAALTAEQQTTERVLAAVAAHTCGGALFRAAGLGPTPRQLHLHRIELFPWDNSFMVILNQIHGQLSSISDDLLADAVPNEGLLEQDVTAVFFIREDRPQIGGCPFRRSCRILNANMGFYHALNAP